VELQECDRQHRERRYLVRPSYMVYIEAAFILLLSLFASFLMSRYGFINRMGITATFIFFSSLWDSSFSWSWISGSKLSIALALVQFLRIFHPDVVVTQRTLGLTSKESIETNRMLGLSLHSQGLLDLLLRNSQDPSG